MQTTSMKIQSMKVGSPIGSTSSRDRYREEKEEMEGR
jgi:hypothetical protein